MHKFLVAHFTLMMLYTFMNYFMLKPSSSYPKNFVTKTTLEIFFSGVPALAIILGGSYSYTEALAILKIDTLESRRTTLCLKFALKAVKKTKFSGWFAPNDSLVNTRSVKLPFKKINCRTRRFRKSPIPYLTDLLNTYLPTKI